MMSVIDWCPYLESISFRDFDQSKSNLTEIARVAGLVRQASVGGKYVKGTKPKLDSATLGERPTPMVKTLITKIEGTGGYGGLNMKALFEAFPAEVRANDDSTRLPPRFRYLRH